MGWPAKKRASRRLAEKGEAEQLDAIICHRPDYGICRLDAPLGPFGYMSGSKVTSRYGEHSQDGVVLRPSWVSISAAKQPLPT